MNVDKRLADTLRERREAEAEARAEAEVQRRLTIIAAYGSDVFADGDVVRFTKVYEDDDASMKYWFAAIKANGRWYVTSTNPQLRAGKTWDEFIEFLVTGPRPTEYVTVMLIGRTHPVRSAEAAASWSKAQDPA